MTIAKAYQLAATETEVAGRKVSIISLGEAGRGRKQTSIPCPTGLKFGDFVDVSVPDNSGAIKKKPKILLAVNQKVETPTVWCARLNCDGSYVRGADGNVSYDPEQATSVPKLVARGYGAFGIAGRTGNWDDLIILVTDGTILRLKPARGEAVFLLFERNAVEELDYDQLDLVGLQFDLDNRVRIRE